MISQTLKRSEAGETGTVKLECAERPRRGPGFVDMVFVQSSDSSVSHVGLVWFSPGLVI